MKKILLLLFLICLLPACGKMGKDGRLRKDIDWSKWYYDDQQMDDDSPSIKIMSFNVRYGSASEPSEERMWTNRRTGCYAMVNTERPVLMGVQECMLNQRTDLMDNCPDYESIGRSRDNTATGEQMDIFYLKDSVTIRDWGTFWLTDTPDEVSKHPGAGNYRCATWARVIHNRTGIEFYHINTHLDLAEVRGFEMVVIMNFINASCGTLPVVLTADWNTTEDDAIFDDMFQTFRSARATAVTGDAYGTYNGFSNYSGSRLDHIFYRGFSSCSKFMTVRQSWEGYQFISDHFPVYATLKFQ